MRIRQYSWNIVDSNSWLITKDSHGLLIDAVENEGLFEEIKKLSDLTIILTHSHFDHIIGLNRIRELRPDATVVSTSKCSEYLGNIHRNMSSSATAYLKFYEGGRKDNIEIEPFSCKASDVTFENQLEYEWFGHNLSLKSIHGHSNDSLVAILDDRFLFSGDTLLNVPTITRFPSGSKKLFRDEDIPFLSSIYGIETVYPGHGRKGLLEDMLRVNES